MRKKPKRTSVKEALKETLQRLAGKEPGGAKALAKVAGVSPRAAESWLYDATAPGTVQLLELAAHYDEVWDLICLLTGRRPVTLSAEKKCELAKLLACLLEDEGGR